MLSPKELERTDTTTKLVTPENAQPSPSPQLSVVSSTNEHESHNLWGRKMIPEVVDAWEKAFCGDCKVAQKRG